jgi:Ca2+-binding EF-hand superfamily protein
MRLSCLLVAMTLLASFSASAQDSRSEYLRLFDSNGDGRVSETEYLAYMSRSFQAMDSNGDGILETDELPGSRGRPITLQAYQDNLRAQFHKLDRNRDGYLSARELTAPPR